MTCDLLPLPNGWGESGLIVAIPARDEADLLPRALSALSRDRIVRDVIVIANGCRDGTAKIVSSPRRGLRVAVLVTGPLAGGVGEARRLGFAAALDHVPMTRILATTDADCRVGVGWGASIIAALECADVACGRIVPEPRGFARLPEIVRYHGQLEDRASDLRAELEGLEHPRSYDPLPRHGQAAGASLAFRTEAYLRAGGFEPIRCHEDRRIVDRIERAGGRISRPYGLHVTASCRRVGRAEGGMADTIAARTRQTSILRDEIVRLHREIAQLEAAIVFHRRDLRSIPRPANMGEQNVPSFQ